MLSRLTGKSSRRFRIGGDENRHKQFYVASMGGIEASAYLK